MAAQRRDLIHRLGRLAPRAAGPAWRAVLSAAIAIGACTGGADPGASPTTPTPAGETVTVTYRDAATGAAVDGRVAYTDATGNAATAATGATIAVLEGTRLSIEAAGYSRKETSAGGQVDGAYWGIPAALQAEVDRARGAGGLQRPGLDKSFDVVLDRLTFDAAQREAVRAALETAAPRVTAGRYRWRFTVGDDPSPRSGVYAVAVAGGVTFEPFLTGDEIEGGRTGLDPSSPRLPALARQAAARMVGCKSPAAGGDPAVYRIMTRLPIGNRAPNVDP